MNTPNLPRPETVLKYSSKAAGPREPESQESKGTETPAAATPSTFELATLAAILDSRSIGTAEPPETPVARAADIWEAASRAVEAAAQCKAILAGVFTAKEPDWRSKIANYTGDKQRLAVAIQGQSHSLDRVLRELFRSKNETRESRLKQFAALLVSAREAPQRHPDLYRNAVCAETGLPRVASGKHGMAAAIAAEKRDGALASNDPQANLNGWQCRWLAVARQKQVSEIRTAAIAKRKPKSLKARKTGKPRQK